MPSTLATTYPPKAANMPASQGIDHTSTAIQSADAPPGTPRLVLASAARADAHVALRDSDEGAALGHANGNDASLAHSIAEEAAAQNAPIPERLDWRALWADEQPDEFILYPILPARRAITIYSAPKLGKSLLTLELVVAISLGSPVLDTKPDRAHRVLYLDFENDPRGDIRSRLEAMGYGPNDLDQLCYLSLPQMPVLDSPAGGKELMRAVVHYDCDVVVIDTISRAVAGEENDNDTWLAFYRHTGLPLKQAGVALIRLDHSGKDVTKGQRGGPAKSGDVDAVWHLTKAAGGTLQLQLEASRFPVPVGNRRSRCVARPCRDLHTASSPPAGKTHPRQESRTSLRRLTTSICQPTSGATSPAGYSMRGNSR